MNVALAASQLNAVYPCQMTGPFVDSNIKSLKCESFAGVLK